MILGCFWESDSGREWFYEGWFMEIDGLCRSTPWVTVDYCIRYSVPIRV